MSCYGNNCRTITPTPFIPAYGCGPRPPKPEPEYYHWGDHIITEKGDHMVTERQDHIVLE